MPIHSLSCIDCFFPLVQSHVFPICSLRQSVSGCNNRPGVIKALARWNLCNHGWPRWSLTTHSHAIQWSARWAGGLLQLGWICPNRLSWEKEWRIVVDFSLSNEVVYFALLISISILIYLHCYNIKWRQNNYLHFILNPLHYIFPCRPKAIRTI